MNFKEPTWLVYIVLYVNIVYIFSLKNKELLVSICINSPHIERYLPSCTFQRNFFCARKFFFELFITLVEDVWMSVKLLQSCLTLCDPMDCSPPGSSVQGILWEKILEWVAVPESSRSRDWTLVSYVSSFGMWALYHSRHLGNPL